MIDAHIVDNILTTEMIIDNITRLDGKVQFIEFYKDNEYFNTCDIENCTLWEEFSLEFFIGEEYSSAELNEDSELS